MRCYICNKEPNSFRRDPDGKFVSICAQCRQHIYDCNRLYQDIEDEDIRVLKMTAKDFEKEMKNDSRKTNKETTSVSS